MGWTEGSARGCQSAPSPLPTAGSWPLALKGPHVGVWGPPGVLPVPRVDPAGGAARVVYVVDLAVEVARLLPALRQGQLRPGHLPKRGPRSPMQLPAATGAPGSAAPAGCTRPGRPPRHHNGVGGGGTRGLGALVRAGRVGATVHAALRPQPRAARSSRRRALTLPCAPAAARCGRGCAPAVGAARTERSRGRPPPPRGALRPPRRPPPPPPRGRVPSLRGARSAGLRSLDLRLLPPPGAARAVQVIPLPRKREAERRAPGFPGLLPTPSAAGAGPTARDAPPRGTVRPWAGRPYAAPLRAQGDRPSPGSGTQIGTPRS